ncbi:hypothetical protein BDR04DRAFT_1150709 [Suillus decipiens]|nr:hypothetical protein BDR04DRAFT_1150709 [Suillus decipiens]
MDSETDSDVTEIETEEGRNNDAEMTIGDVEVRVDAVNVEDKDLVIGPKFQPVFASPCKLLTRHAGNPNPDPENPTAPWSYYVKKRTEELDSEDQQKEDSTMPV